MQHSSNDPDILVKVEGLGVHRNDRWLIKGIDLLVCRGEIVTIIGPNGAGKSTCIKSILNLISYEEGTIERLPGLTIGYVPQKLNIDWTLPMSVGRLMTLTQKHSTQEIEKTLATVKIEHLLHRNIQDLSGGEFQRLLLARALIRKPDLLILDEPVQGVDFSGEIALYELISRIKNEFNCGILMISHDLHIVMAETDHVICLNQHICCSGPPKSVTKNPEYQKIFGAQAANVFSVYQHDINHDHSHEHEEGCNH